MLEVADILRSHSAAYNKSHHLLPSHWRTINDLTACRTAALGGQLYRCDHCEYLQFSYHSCRNRHCPKCHREQTERWLEQHQEKLLPCSYYLLTFTPPSELRAVV